MSLDRLAAEPLAWIALGLLAVALLLRRPSAPAALIAGLAELSGRLDQLTRAAQAQGMALAAQMEALLRDALPAAALSCQHTLSTGARADAVIRLPTPPGPIAVDSKFPLEAIRRRALRVAAIATEKE